MKVRTLRHSFPTRGNAEVHDLTGAIRDALRETSMQEGQVTVFAVGSTGAVTTVEFEPGLVQDLRDLFDRLAPPDLDYAHHRTWNDGNGHSHCRASLVGSSLSIPFVDGQLVLGTWQQVIFLDFDVRPRSRQVVFQFLGETA